MKQTGKIALGGVLGALALVVMFFSAIPTVTYAVPAIAGALLVPLVIEYGAGAGITVYAAVAVLALILAPDKEASLLFAAFFGHYPVIKALIEKAQWNRWVTWGVKLLIFNFCTILAYMLMIFVFALPMDSFTIGDVNLMWAFLLAGNVVFVLYDIALTRVIGLYWYRFRDRLMRLFHR